jgi:hypothetical protein
MRSAFGARGGQSKPIEYSFRTLTEKPHTSAAVAAAHNAARARLELIGSKSIGQASSATRGSAARIHNKTTARYILSEVRGDGNLENSARCITIGSSATSAAIMKQQRSLSRP